MDRSSLNFLYGANVKTATEASLRASQVASSVSALIRNKSAMRHHASLGLVCRRAVQHHPKSYQAINDSLINKPLGASEMAQLVNLYTNDLLSKRTVLEELQRGGVLDPDLKIDDEIDRIDEDKEAEHELQHQEAEQKLGEDLKRADEFQKKAPTQPGQAGQPSSGQSSAGKEQAAQEKANTEKAAEQAK